ncbi:MAG: hypothetical protein JJU45_15055 [Acidimicrobiia bacterium]|nr:hypothetical protein [Acidimicrobiia bacterium]
MTVVVATLAAVVVLLAVLVVGLLRSHAEILRRLHELGAGVYEDDDRPATRPAAATPRAQVTDDPDEIRTRPGVPEPRTESTDVVDLVGSTPQGGAKTVRVAGTTNTTLLAFLSSGCGTCGAFWQAFAGGEADRLPGTDTRLVIVTKGPEAESPAAVAGLAPTTCTTIMSSDAYEAYGVPVSPYFILVDGPTSQIVGEGAAGSWPQVRNLLEQAAADGGMVVDGASLDSESRRRVREGGRQREARADAELAAAGIGPGHQSLYPTAAPGGPSPDAAPADPAAPDARTDAGRTDDGAPAPEPSRD